MMKKYLIIIVVVSVALLGLVLLMNFRIKTPVKIGQIFPTPTNSEQKNVPDNWQLYKSEKFGYSIYFPKEYEANDNGDFSIIITLKEETEAVGPVNFIYVSIVPEGQTANEGEIYNYNPQQYDILMQLEIGESLSLADPGQPELNEWFFYTRVDDSQIDGKTARRFENNKPWEFPEATTEVRYIFEDKGTIYILGSYTGGENVKATIDPRIAHQIITSFRLE